MTNLISQLKTFVIAINRSFGNRNQENTLLTISKYWEQAFYNCFYNIDKSLGSDKYFCHLGTIVKQDKSVQMLIAL